MEKEKAKKSKPFYARFLPGRNRDTEKPAAASSAGRDNSENKETAALNEMKKSENSTIKSLLSRLRRKPEKTAAAAESANPALILRSKTARNPLIVFANFIFMLAAFLILAGALAVYGIKTIYERPSEIAQAQVKIPFGAGASAIADILKKRGLINNPLIFICGTYLDDKVKLLKAGEYEIPAQASMRDIAAVLARGRAVQYSITLPEGLTVAQIFAKLAENPLLTGDLPQRLPAEGVLLTDTVKFTRGTARAEIVRRLETGQARLIDEIWAERAADLPLKNKQEMLILASIVEKETGIAAERPRVAAVFYNRLKKNMRLQSDPTVLYGLFGGQGRPADRPLYRSDLDKETPYNTYKIFGLPPAPICNPGRDSLLAVANPPSTEDLYFVADGTGGHIFAKSLSEHNNNVAKWRNLKKTLQNNADSNSAQESQTDKSE